MNVIGWLGGGTAPVIIAVASQQFGMSACLSAASVIPTQPCPRVQSMESADEATDFSKW